VVGRFAVVGRSAVVFKLVIKSISYGMFLLSSEVEEVLTCSSVLCNSGLVLL